jgi:DNA-binding response OmpR family regulator
VGQATFNALVLVEDSSAGLILGELAAESHQVSVLRSLDRVPDTNHEIARLLNSTEPDLVFIDLSARESALRLIDAILGHAAGTAIIGLSASMAGRQSFDQAGVAAYLERPFTLGGFQSSVRDAIRKVRAGVSEKLNVFLPAKAGSGCTTVALNVAGALAARPGKKTLLIETDLHSGVLSTLLNITPSLPVVEALARAATLDYSVWTIRSTRRRPRYAAHGSRQDTAAAELDELPPTAAFRPNPL